MNTSRTNWLLLINAGLGSFLAGTASRIVAVSLPTLASSLETTIVGISWAVIAYQLSQVSLSLVFGRIGDLYGRQTMFSVGLVVSALGALLCGFSQNITQLILFRLFHGVGASMTQSQARALAAESLPKQSSGKAQGVMTTAFHSGVLIGPSIGGLIIDTIHWRAVFFFLVPIALAGIALAVINRKRDMMSQRPAADGAQPEIDYLGAVLLVAATVALVALVDYRIMEIVRGSLRVGLIAGFAGLFVGFLYRESSTRSPILDLSLFRIRMFTLSSLSLLMVGVAQVMIGFVLPFYLQDILHLSPSFMGLLFISAPIFTVVLSPWVGWVTDKVGPRLPATVGLSFLVGGAFLGGFLRADSHWTFAVAVLALWGLAMALFYPPNHTAMISSVPDQHRGVATGAIYVMFGLGTTVGVSLSTLLLTAAFRYYSGDATATPTAANAVVFVKSMNFCFFMSGITGLAAMVCSAMRGQQAPSGAIGHASLTLMAKG